MKVQVRIRCTNSIWQFLGRFLERYVTKFVKTTRMRWSFFLGIRIEFLVMVSYGHLSQGSFVSGCYIDKFESLFVDLFILFCIRFI